MNSESVYALICTIKSAILDDIARLFLSMNNRPSFHLLSSYQKIVGGLLTGLSHFSQQAHRSGEWTPIDNNSNF